MKIFSCFFLNISLLVGYSTGFGQDTILFINGKERMADHIVRSEGQLSYRWLKPKSRTLSVEEFMPVSGLGAVKKSDVISGQLLDKNESVVRFQMQDGSVREFSPEEVMEVQPDLLVPNSAKVKPGYCRQTGNTLELYAEKRRVSHRETRVFSIRGEQETVIYRQDTLSRQFFVPENEARAYIYGRRSARKNYESVGTYIASGAIGIGGGILNYFYIPLPMLAFTLTNAAILPQVKQTGPEDQAFLSDPDFVAGYRFQAGKRKFRNALITGIPGVILGGVGRALYYGYIY